MNLNVDPTSGNTVEEASSAPAGVAIAQTVPVQAVTTRIKDQPIDQRPRERLEKEGADALRSADLIAILLRTGTQGRNAVQVGEEMVNKFGSLTALARCSIEDLRSFKGVGRDKAVTLIAAFALGRKMAKEMQRESPVLDNPDAVANLMREEARVRKVETFQALLLNTRRRLIDIAKVSDGTLDTVLVHPREVFKPAIASNASAIVLVHNHPSGDPSPSEADIRVTRDLIRAGQLLKIDVLDHIILGTVSQDRQKDYVSLRELGYFY